MYGREGRIFPERTPVSSGLVTGRHLLSHKESDESGRMIPVGTMVLGMPGCVLSGRAIKEAEMKVFAAALAAVGLVGGAILPAQAAPKPVVVFEDTAGDAGNQDGAVPGFTEAGFDLIKGEITREKKDVKFIVTHAAMPASGPPGEMFRLIWGISVSGKVYEMTIKSLDVGEPDVIASAMGQDPNGEERVGQVYQGVARLEECGTISLGISWSQCEAVGYYDALFDPETATATWLIDMKTLGAKKGSVITAGATGRAATGCTICWVPQYQERSLTPQSIIDSAVMTGTYKVR